MFNDLFSSKNSHGSHDQPIDDEKGPVSHPAAPANEVGEVYDVLAQDAVFGEVKEGGPNYRNVR